LVIVIAVAGIASLGLSVTIQQALRDSYKPEVMATATALAVKEAERVITLSFNNTNNENRDNPQSFPGDFAAYSWQVRVDSIDTAQPNLGSDPGMQYYKMVEVRIHNSAINYVSIKFLKTKYQ
jgi:hypothetical protein